MTSEALRADHQALPISGQSEDAPILGSLDLHLIAEGNHWQLYEKLGAHPQMRNGTYGVAFALWAPNASHVSVVGDFNHWDSAKNPMRLRAEAGIWELFVPGLDAGEIYKFEIIDRAGHRLPPKADPFAFESERPPHTASRIAAPVAFTWTDQAWLERRKSADPLAQPISIYECHLASWARIREEGNRYLTYDELAARLIPYVRDMGFTHIELMPVSEYPFDGSWGYQPTGLFAPTSRFGSPDAFARFVDRCHSEGLGIILDWVPGHFPDDPHGLSLFDGTHLYEHADPRLGFHKDWNTLIYNYGRREVENFLLANALYWLDRFHIDGLRVDAVASMLYLDYSRKPGEWLPNRNGGRENLEAVAFLRKLNMLVHERHPGVLTIAEESTSWPGVTRPVVEGGLGFSFKWNMGWMHDTLRYMSKDPIHRSWHQDDLTFGLVYAFSENFVLPLSHDEVVHGKGSLIHKMPGDQWQRFANLRAYLTFMFAHPGKKLLFMGTEIAQEQEWNHDRSLDWHLLANPLNLGVQTLIRELNMLYRRLPSFYERDGRGDGFSWIDYTDRAQSVISFMRRNEKDVSIGICNFTPTPRQPYRIGVPHAGFYRETVNSDSMLYGGSNMGNGGGVTTESIAAHGHPFSISLTLPPLATLILEHVW